MWQVIGQVVGVLAGIAQAIIAAIAVYWGVRAYRASRASAQATKDTISLPRMLLVLSEVLAAAREVQRKYEQLFGRFGSERERNEARTTWLVAREAVREQIGDVVLVYPELASVLHAWEEVEDEEHPHIFGHVLTALDDKAFGDAKQRYGKRNESFRAVIRDIVQKLRANERAPLE